MKKRLRKKKHLGEFRQYGFSLDCRLRPGTSGSVFGQFIDDFISQSIEAHGSVFGGGGSPGRGWSGFICRGHRYDSTTEADKTAVENWLRGRSEVEFFRLSDFIDAWHGPDTFDEKTAERKLLQKQLEMESRRVQKNSMEVLEKFEQSEDRSSE